MRWTFALFWLTRVMLENYTCGKSDLVRGVDFIARRTSPHWRQLMFTERGCNACSCISIASLAKRSHRRDKRYGTAGSGGPNKKFTARAAYASEAGYYRRISQIPWASLRRAELSLHRASPGCASDRRSRSVIRSKAQRFKRACLERKRSSLSF